MAPTTHFPIDLLAVLDAGGAVVTSNDTVSRDLQIRYSLARRSRGDRVWQRPRIQSFRRFTIALWEECWPATQLLNPVQELVLWKGVIDGSDAGRNLISSTATARAARRAATLATTYRISLGAEDGHSSSETEAFQVWHRLVVQRLEEMGWTTQDRLVDELIRMIGSGSPRLPPAVATYGFLAMTPQEREFFDALRGAGLSVVEVPGEPAGACVLRRAADPRDEARRCAFAIHERLQEAGGDGNSVPRIGVLVADVSEARELLEPIFTEILAPHRYLPHEGEAPIPWRYNRGQSLVEHELVSSALTALTLSLYDNDTDLVSRFLLNRRFGNGPESLARASIDVALRESVGRRIGLGQILRLATTDGPTAAPVFGERIRCLMEQLESTDGSALPSAWAERYRARLRCLGWPGVSGAEESLQALHGFEECLRVFGAMDRQMGSINGNRAFAWLRELCAAREYERHVRYSQPVQVVAWDDAAGMVFDVAYVLGATAGRLPSAAKATPFLPLEAQVARGVPDATPEASLGRARRVIDAMSRVAGEVVWSCPLHGEDGTLLGATPLLTGWPEIADVAREGDTLLGTVLRAGVQTTVPTDDPIPPVGDPAVEGIRGGVSILENFAAMPFAAFVRHRLGVRPFPLAQAGLRAAEQGQMIHAVLEGFWRRTRTRAALRALDPPSLTAEIRRSLTEVEASKGYLPGWRYGRRLVELERRRLEELLREWLEMEAARNEDFEVLQTELPVSTMVGRLPIAVRIDRIDRVTTASGDHYLLLDYKTGATVNPSGWQPDVMSEPQLPFYASCLDLGRHGVPHVDGIAFAHVGETRCGFHARLRWTWYLVPVDGGRAAAVPNWDVVQRQWKDVIESTVGQFLDGDARAFYGESLGPEYHDLSVFLRSDTAP